jgi:hypothetical protein
MENRELGLPADHVLTLRVEPVSITRQWRLRSSFTMTC